MFRVVRKYVTKLYNIILNPSNCTFIIFKCVDILFEFAYDHELHNCREWIEGVG